MGAKQVSDVSIGGYARRVVLPAVMFIWPVVFFFRHVFPASGLYTAIGNDFYALYCKYKIYLLACLADSHMPLWSPAEGAGYPFRDNFFTQSLYPLNALLLLWYKVAGGYCAFDHQIFTILGLSIFSVGLFMWLRLVNSNLRAVVFSTAVMSVSFKIVETLRFPNAVHTAAWYPWILYSLTGILFSRSLRAAVVNGILLAAFGILLCTGGYPYFLYYSIFLFGPYLAVCLLRPLRCWLFGDRVAYWRRAIVTLLVAGFVVVVTCGPYLIRGRYLLAETADRPLRDFTYSTAHVFNFEDTAGSLVYPPAASPEGWYFFSVTALLIIAGFFFSRATGSDEVEQRGVPLGNGLAVKLFFLIWIAAVSYITYGRSSYLFILLWKFMPGFPALRVWPRLNIILVPVIAWLLSIAYANLESVICKSDTKRQMLRYAAVAAVVYAVILAGQCYLHFWKVRDELWLQYFSALAKYEIRFIIYGAVGCAAVLAIAVIGCRYPLTGARLTAVMVLLVLVSALEMRGVASRMWTYEGDCRQRRTRLDVAGLNAASFRIPRTDHANTIALGPNFSVGTIENWYFSRYLHFLRKTENEPEARRTLLGVKDGTKIFFSESIEHQSIRSFLEDALRYRETGRLISYNGDELVWEIEAPAAGYLSFIDNWDEGWKVEVDGRAAKMELLFGTFKAVRLEKGKHRIRFYYRPRLIPLELLSRDDGKT